MVKKKSLLDIIVGLAIILTAVFTILNHIGFFDQPEIFPVKQSENSDYPACPDSFRSQFPIFFSNVGGANVELCVNVLSDDIDFKKNQNCLVVTHDKDKTIPFLFDIDTNSLHKYSAGGNASITFSWQYKWYYFNKKDSYPCNYRKEKHDSQFRLVKSS